MNTGEDSTNGGSAKTFKLHLHTILAFRAPKAPIAVKPSAPLIIFITNIIKYSLHVPAKFAARIISA